MRNRDDVTDSLSSFQTQLIDWPGCTKLGTCHLLIDWPIVQLKHGHFMDRILRNSHPSRMARLVMIDSHPRVRVSTMGTSGRVVLITAPTLSGQGEVSWLRRSTAGTHVSQARDYSTGVW